MAKSQQSFNKKEREKKKRKKRQEKLERREQRKLEKDAAPKKTFADQISYLDEDGNLTDTPPDPTKKKKVIKLEDIIISTPPTVDVVVEKVRKGIVKFFNDDKGYGFIVDSKTKDNIFVHINNCPGPLKEHDKVSFELEEGHKGIVAVDVKLISDEEYKPTAKKPAAPKPVEEKPADVNAATEKPSEDNPAE
jgi:cold shock CspA family protein